MPTSTPAKKSAAAKKAAAKRAPAAVLPAAAEDRPETIGVNVRLPYDLHRRLKIRAIERDTTLAEAIREAAEKWVSA